MSFYPSEHTTHVILGRDGAGVPLVTTKRRKNDARPRASRPARVILESFDETDPVTIKITWREWRQEVLKSS